MKTDYGYKDKRFLTEEKWTSKKKASLVLAILFIVSIWFYLDHKLIFGQDWISETYDNEEWRTNEGDLHTYGAWDLEAHIWKTEYIMKYFPNFQWNPFWYMGMPLLEYYQSGFYALHIAFIMITGLSPARAALWLIMLAHLVGVMFTFLLCYKISKRIWASAMPAVFLLASTFITLRSYGWEPISIVFIFLYPLTLLIFLKYPTEPFRLSVILLLTLSYLCHPLIFFSLAMSMGIYLFAIALKENEISPEKRHKHYILKYFGAIFASLALGAVQFIPQFFYKQVTSGAHMGVTYIPFYHVHFNIINLKDFLFDAGNLKGPGFSIMVAFTLLFVFLWFYRKDTKTIFKNHFINGFLLIAATMILFYYLERFNIFPMNVLRSIQYHRIIPEFIIAAAVLTSSISMLIKNNKHMALYYSILIAFVLASFIVVYNVQGFWQTSSSISDRPEFIYDTFPGRISFPYTDQSLSVRNSFTEVSQTYGYYEQGITNAYADEVFSVSSGYHSADVSILYLKAANVARLYINTEEGKRDQIVYSKFINRLTYHEVGRYAYFDIPLVNPGLVQTVDKNKTEQLQAMNIQCRVMFKEEYCGSVREEFVTKDPEEIRYLTSYVDLIEENISSSAMDVMINPEHYQINIANSDMNTAVLIKMTYSPSFKAFIDGEEIKVEKIGPDFMVIKPNKQGDYTIDLKYGMSKKILIGAIISLFTLITLIIYFSLIKGKVSSKAFTFKGGDMHG